MGGPLISVGTGAPDLGIDPGTYPATLVGVKPRTISSEFGDNQPMLEWQFEIPTEDGGVIPVNGLTSMFTGPKSKTYKFLTALLGKVDVGQGFDEADLVGKSCLVNIEPNASGWMRVTDVMAPPRGAAAAKVGPTAPVQAPGRPSASERSKNTNTDNVSPIRATVRAQAGETADTDDLPF